MGQPYLILDQHLSNITINSAQEIVLEIGSERGEGSTEFLHNWAKRKKAELYSVDVIKYNGGIFDNTDIRFIVHDSGSAWCRDILPTLNKKIKILYLDNFDYIRPGWENLEKIKNQIKQYAERGIDLNNENCIDEHRLQAEYCLPFMADESVIIMDDTEFDQAAFDAGQPIEQTWHGKCSKVIPMLIQNYFTIEIGTDSSVYAYRQHTGSWTSSQQVYN